MQPLTCARWTAVIKGRHTMCTLHCARFLATAVNNSSSTLTHFTRVVGRWPGLTLIILLSIITAFWVKRRNCWGLREKCWSDHYKCWLAISLCWTLCNEKKKADCSNVGNTVQQGKFGSACKSTHSLKLWLSMIEHCHHMTISFYALCTNCGQFSMESKFCADFIPHPYFKTSFFFPWPFPSYFNVNEPLTQDHPSLNTMVALILRLLFSKGFHCSRICRLLHTLKQSSLSQ